MNKDLKPCPFCGGEAEIERYGTPRDSTIYSCRWCGCWLETGEERDHGARWNTRAPDPASEQMAEALKSVKHWAVSRCPCKNEQPDPCPLCGATVDGLEACKALLEVIPPRIVEKMDAALASWRKSKGDA